MPSRTSAYASPIRSPVSRYGSSACRRWSAASGSMPWRSSTTPRLASVLAWPSVDAAGVAESFRLPAAEAGRTVQGQRLAEIAVSPRVAGLPPVEAAEVVQRVGFAEPVARLTVQAPGLMKVADSLPAAALPDSGDAEGFQRVRFRGQVAALAGSAARAGLDGDRLGNVAADVEVPAQGGGQPCRVARPPAGGGVHGNREQA